MDIKFIKSLDGTTLSDRYKKGDVVKDAEMIFGTRQAQYFVEEGVAEAVGSKPEIAVGKKAETADLLTAIQA